MTHDSWLDRLNDPPETFWEPQPDEIIVGEVVAIREDRGRFDPYPVLLLDTDSGRKAVRGNHTALRNKIELRDPRVGDTVGIRYCGEVTSSNGRTYFDYRFEVKPGDRDEQPVEEPPDEESREFDPTVEDPWASPSTGSAM